MGKFNSSLTRVKPLFDTLRMYDDCIARLLAPINKDIRVPERLLEICYGENEKLIQPSRKLLNYLVSNPKILKSTALGLDDGKETYAKRKKILEGDLETLDEALMLINDEAIPTKPVWYVFEGYTHPDIYIETENYIIIGEAKRTEKKLTKSTTWMDPRDQLIRHIDSVLDRPKNIISFFIVDATVAQENKYDKELAVFKDIKNFTESLPHRSQPEVRRAMDSYIGHCYWQDFEKIYGPIFPDTL